MGITPNESIRFCWLDSEPPAEFGFTISEDELTGDIALIVTDHVEEEEEADVVNLWNSQISRLKHEFDLSNHHISTSTNHHIKFFFSVI